MPYAAAEPTCAYRNLIDELRITRAFPCVARGLKVRPSFMFVGCCWWRSLAVDGSSGTSRGHAPVMRRPDPRNAAVLGTVQPGCGYCAPPLPPLD